MKSTFRRLAYRCLKPLLAATGNELLPLRRFEKSGFTAAALGRVKARGIKVGTFLDVGASDGRWSVQAQSIFSESRYHLFEPLDERLPALKRLCALRPNFSFVPAAASTACGSGFLNVAGDLDGSSLVAEGAHGRQIALTCIDHEVESRNLPAPYAIKLDTHGAEVDIIRGAAKTLASTELLIIEAYNFPLGGSALLFHQLCAHMECLGFRVSDLVDLAWRPGDQMLWQMDLFFQPAHSREFQQISFAPPETNRGAPDPC